MSRLALVPVNTPARATAPTLPTLRAGDLYYNTTTGLNVYDGTQWIVVGSTLTDIDGGQPDSIAPYSGAYPDTVATQSVTGGTP